MPSLVMVSPAPVIESRAREVILDVGFVEGMKLHCQFWPGQVCCVLRRGSARISDGARFSRRQLGFELLILDPDEPIPEVLLDEAGLVYCAADDLQHLDLPDAMMTRIGKLVYSIAQPVSTRIMAAMADTTRPFPRRLRAALWNLQHEPALRRALRRADGLHVDGYMADAVYRRFNANTLAYLDNRMRRTMQARTDDQASRFERLRNGKPLRLAWYGTLDTCSGVTDLVRTMFLLRSHGATMSLDIFGTGPIEGQIRASIEGLGLGQSVRLLGKAEFAAVLAPHLRRECDLFVSARRLSDPQASYLEAMGCGLPVLSYANATWREICRHSGAGWESRTGSVSAMARRLMRLDGERELIVGASERALTFSRANTFETVFERRMTHLRGIGRIE